MATYVHAIIVADGDVDASVLAAVVAADSSSSPSLLIAADGGAGRALTAGTRPDLVVGDLDSLTAADRTRLDDLGIEIRLAPSDKDESDMELCLLAALDAGASRISIVGALGGSRPEHTIANLLLLADPRLDRVDAALITTDSRIRRIGSADGPGTCLIEGAPGDFVSLFPIGGAVAGVTTDGLRFPLRDESLPVGPSRGLSNELLRHHASVSSRRGCLLVVHSDRTPHR